MRYFGEMQGPLAPSPNLGGAFYDQTMTAEDIAAFDQRSALQLERSRRQTMAYMMGRGTADSDVNVVASILQQPEIQGPLELKQGKIICPAL